MHAFLLRKFFYIKSKYKCFEVRYLSNTLPAISRCVLILFPGFQLFNNRGDSGGRVLVFRRCHTCYRSQSEILDATKEVKHK